MSIKVLLVDDHDIVRAGLRSILQQEPTVTVIGEAEDGRAAVKLVRKLSPNIVLMDIGMPEMNGFEATRQIMGLGTRAKVIAQTMRTDAQSILDMLQAGASGYLVKQAIGPHLIPAILAVSNGDTYMCPQAARVVLDRCLHHPQDGPNAVTNLLTSREREVLQLLCEGKTSKEIASILAVTPKTVESHRAQLMMKLDIHSVAGLTKFAIRQGLTSADD